MIKINLLPTKKVRRKDAGQRQLIYMGAGVLAGIAGLLFLHLSTESELDDKRQQAAAMQAELEILKAEMGDYDKIKGQREELTEQKKTIAALQLGRTGPVYLLREISEILTPNKGPTFDRVSYEEQLRRDPNVGFNPNWDTRRVWLTAFQEKERMVRIDGSAKSNEDVAEFLKRLQLSVFFGEVKVQSTSQVVTDGVKHVNFSLTARVKY